MSKYGFTPSEIFWIGSNNKEGSENFECVVRVENITINFDQILEILERSDKIGQTLKRIQTDIFNVVKIYDELANDKRSVGGINIEKGKYYGMNEVEDS